MKTNRIKLLSFPYVLWMTAFIIIPLFIVIFYGVTDKNGAFTLENIKSIIEPVHRNALFEALLLSLISTVICLFLSYPLGLILINSKLKRSGFIFLLFILPMWMNFLLRTMAWQNILEKNGILNRVLTFFGLPAANLINTPGAIVLGMVYNFLPFMILPIYNSLAKISKDTVNAARDLGANSFVVFTKIILPLTIPGIVSGITMVFVPSLTTFAISDILGGSKILLIGNVIEQEFKVANNWHSGSGLSLVLMVFILFSMFLMSKYDKDGMMSNGL